MEIPPTGRPAFLSDAGEDMGNASLVRRVASRELVGERGELVIVHDGREYRLRITKNGKLILTA